MNANLPSPWLSMLEEIRSIAQLGLHYATGDHFDQARYRRLLELASFAYAGLAELPAESVLQRFQSELGHVTPKVGVNGAIFNEAGQILLLQRRDDQCWSLPAGWCDMNETPREALVREIHEELNLTAEAGNVVEIFTRKPGEWASPHTAYLILLQAKLLGGTPRCHPDEVLDWGWFNPEAELNWHRDHQSFARRARDYRLQHG
ncbi:MAG: hypothetical protein CVV27_11250 [Candidatus Melainabacteria bacterium HGW-Melainabacteria-1]|nr:MAG: hypothetical protein CVV27_11250 [Candidatus Melainabacteria bacterium HGW-Melainabacteria-1]